ncbi:Aspartate 1-decarboxylase [Helicobacter heilmannii]|uniref:Aspartate 1-decarboxylase n=1 Tax=Helicobacter heilmannii TaxID=35817 RepID=A0A0K2XIQ7_HELHE|nr:aspartate 1-decarboxylase [Helicobacter heilmannii]CCM10788.1 Aspartate 1-decarboxylase [Helicobacter heilmannii ASB1.4]CRF45967.1 Aspartate 1-decarboxylase [Helicobacter heilmannii]CRF47006.1 Aspartate 1-decarboxylase [Helicobacter heilmannii]CRF48544.1 Aspartate 1-decarboxylase [Helicobacter heilmannii]CRF51815.1 Aspartate 1-decarboxylase [Helicobacter heilmannii]
MPLIQALYSKIHRAVVTDANLNYEGSITLGADLLKASKLAPFMKVDILNINNGARFSTYVIAGVGCEVCINGAASRLVQKGDLVIIVAYVALSLEELEGHKPHIVFVDHNNAPKKDMEC